TRVQGARDGPVRVTAVDAVDEQYRVGEDVGEARVGGGERGLDVRQHALRLVGDVDGADQDAVGDDGILSADMYRGRAGRDYRDVAERRAVDQRGRAKECDVVHGVDATAVSGRFGSG